MTAIATLIKFPAQPIQNKFDSGIENRIETVLRHRLKSLVAKARLSCGQLSLDEQFSLEQQVLENYDVSQKTSSPDINRAMRRVDAKVFQTAAVGVAGEIGRSDFETAVDIFEENLENAVRQTIGEYLKNEDMKSRWEYPLALAA